MYVKMFFRARNNLRGEEGEGGVGGLNSSKGNKPFNKPVEQQKNKRLMVQFNFKNRGNILKQMHNWVKKQEIKG